MEMMLELLPSEYESQEINRLTLAYFVVCGLDILGALDRIDKDQVARWVLSFYSRSGTVEPGNCQFYGFHGSRTSQYPLDKQDLSFNASHLASTYCALAILKIIGYDFSNLDSNSISLSMKNLQQPDGSFIPIHFGAERDLRFVYCAAAISSMLNDWCGMDKEKATDYIIKCQSYDGGFGLVPGSESHGGATYCAVAALQLMGYIKANYISRSTGSSVVNVAALLEWALQRQAADGGFQGRPNKASDTCYAFWVVGVLRILGADQFLDKDALRSFLLSCQSEYGGFTKFPGSPPPDLYHSYYGLAAFSLLGEPGLAQLQVELGITALSGALT
ncbi:unnamed protein product [Spirodela intermedia]|uniref:Geranylgeranyl transferase type-1 subunit beta n=1 Tax=Spirodela intermedia TaxID=51605 RepID=A0A7I8JHI1_SPIIN|nr:unnamed protein product [Spirodela intermedia]CAA6669371.1 unnamed protein product [Spirodela intermedia]